MSLVKPAYATRAEFGKTLGPEVADLNALAGFPPDPEQELLLDAIFAVDDFGRSLFFEVDIICCRQNLKTGVLKQAELGWLYITDQRLVVHSAHEMGTTREAFRDLVQLIEGCPALSKRLKPSRNNGIDNGAGREGIELRTGQRIRYKARTSGGGRGLSGDKVVLDEGMFLKPEHLGSLLPTLSARPDPQYVIGSSAGLEQSDVLRRARDRGRAGASERQFYVEWCAPEGICADPACDHELGRDGCALDDEALWLLANPAIGRRITVETIRAERQSLPPEEFARERMGWWDDPDALGRAFTAEAWARCRDSRTDPATGLAVSQILGVPSVALDVEPDHGRASLVVAGPREDGRRQLEVVDHDRERPGVRLRGTGWVVARTKQLLQSCGAPGVRLDPSAAAGALIQPLRDAGVTVIEVSPREYTQACGAIFDAVMEHDTVRHLGQPDLDAAVAAARPKPVGDSAWKWARRDVSEDITPLVAATLALSGVAEGGVSVFTFSDLDGCDGCGGEIDRDVDDDEGDDTRYLCQKCLDDREGQP